MLESASSSRRVRVERGVYLQPNGKYAVCFRHTGRLRFRTVGFDLAAARREREALITAPKRGALPLSPHLRFDTSSPGGLSGLRRGSRQANAGA
jgi:hypothetical protein